MSSRAARAALACALLACGPDKPDEAPPADLRIGQLMVETGHRFETSGHAADAGRWEMAQYQAHEIIELFQADMPRALLPGECNDELADGFYNDLLETHLPALVEAAERQSAQDYDARYATAAQQCNGCHTTCGVPFVEIPTAPGGEVPALGPRGAPARAEAPADDSAEEAAEDGAAAEDSAAAGDSAAAEDEAPRGGGSALKIPPLFEEP